MNNDFNLNELRPSSDYTPNTCYWDLRKDPVTSNDITVYFSDMENSLAKLISQYTVAAGCVAWLTSEKILKALSRMKCASMLIQKEDFMRPDSKSFSNKKIASLYEGLPKGPTRPDSFGYLIDHLNSHNEWACNPVRWVGHYNHERKPYFPRMHHKFLLLGDMVPGFGIDTHGECVENKGKDFSPVAVWTGSFNFTFNSSRSLENAVLIKNPEIVKAYHMEWQRVFAISESIPGYAWKNKWEPEEFRIGS